MRNVCSQALADARAELDAVREAYVSARAERERAEAEARDARDAAARLATRLEAKLDTAAIRRVHSSDSRSWGWMASQQRLERQLAVQHASLS